MMKNILHYNNTPIGIDVVHKPESFLSIFFILQLLKLLKLCGYNIKNLFIVNT